MKKVLLTVAIILWAASAHAATRYIDCAVSSSGDGQSWAAAWKNFDNISGLGAGDTVYISGSASCSTYAVNGWTPINGTISNPITYRIGQDAGHNSPITIINSANPWLKGQGGNVVGVVIDGNYNGTRSITVTGSTIAAGNANGFKLRYINLDSPMQVGTYQNGEMDHIYVDLGSNDNHFYASSASAGDIGYTSNLIHDSTFRLRHYTPLGTGDDGFQWIENASFWNNSWIGVSDGNTSFVNHQDGIQTSGSYVAIYNNYFENMSNSAIFGEFYGNGSHWRIYNNVFNYSDPIIINAGSSSGTYSIGLGCHGSGLTLSDIIVANNTIVYGGVGISLGGYSGCVAVNSSYVVNNIIYGVGNVLDLKNYNGVLSNNATSASNINFVSSSDFHLTSISTAAIDSGINPSYLTAVYTKDKDGISRSQGSAWDVGAYEFAGNSGNKTAKPMAPTSLRLN